MFKIIGFFIESSIESILLCAVLITGMVVAGVSQAPPLPTLLVIGAVLVVLSIMRVAVWRVVSPLGKRIAGL